MELQQKIMQDPSLVIKYLEEKGDYIAWCEAREKDPNIEKQEKLVSLKAEVAKLEVELEVKPIAEPIKEEPIEEIIIK